MGGAGGNDDEAADMIAIVAEEGSEVEGTTKQQQHEAIDMYKLENIGLYTHYAAVGLMGGMSGIARPFCDYVFTDAPANLCANANSIV